MGKFFRNALIAAAAVSMAVSCDKSGIDVAEESLPVNNFNIAGAWELVEWNGAPLDEKTYAYIELTRQGEYTSYTNIETTSVVSSVNTGSYDIDSDDDSIGGYFDYMDYKQWTHRYVISGLTSDRMVWTASDDESEVRVYSRIDAIPDNIAVSGSSDD